MGVRGWAIKAALFLFFGLGLLGSAAAQPMTGKAIITGTVRDESGRPIEGAVVKWGLAASFLGKIEFSKPIKTDEKGRYRIEVPQTNGRPIKVVVESPGMITESFETPQTVKAGQVIERDFTLKPAPIISGRAKGTKGSKRLLIVIEGEGVYGRIWCPINPDGGYRFTLSNLYWREGRRGRICKVTGRAEGYEPVTVENVRLALGEEAVVDFEFKERSAKVSGVAIDMTSGSPVGGVKLLLAEPVHSPDIDPQAVTLPDGSFVFEDVPSGSYTRIYSGSPEWKVAYAIIPPGNAERQEEGGLALSVGSGEEIKGLKVMLVPSIRISGRIFDPDGRPLINAGVKVDFSGNIPPLTGLVVEIPQMFGRTGCDGTLLPLYTDGEGRYEFISPRPFLKLESIAIEFGGKKVTKRLSLKPGDVLERCDFSLGARAIVRGRVLGEGGKPIANEELEIGYEYSGKRGSGRIRTDEEGCFEYRHVKGEPLRWLTVMRGDLSASYLIDAEPGEVRTGIVFNLTREMREAEGFVRGFFKAIETAANTKNVNVLRDFVIAEEFERSVEEMKRSFEEIERMEIEVIGVEITKPGDEEIKFKAEVIWKVRRKGRGKDESREIEEGRLVKEGGRWKIKPGR